MLLRRGVVCLLVLASAGAGVASPQAPAPVGPGFVVPVSTARVEVDLVVRDKRGWLVRDLRADEVELLEDGVRQDIESLAFVEHGTRPQEADPVVVALAFDRLGAAARRFAYAAALEYVRERRLPESQVGVFAIDRGLRTLQPFTDDVDALRAALATMSGTGSTTLAGQRERELSRNAYHGLGEGLGQAHVAAAESRGAPECRGREEVRIRLTEMLESRLVEGFEALERDQAGFGSVHALLALIGALGELPGRKALLLFSEGLAVPSNVEATYHALVGAANRARVTLYSVDAGGLRVESPGDEMRRTLDHVKTRVRNDSSDGRLTEDDPLAMLEKNEGALRLTAVSTLGPLADQTGGFTISGTNQLADGVGRLEEELRAHYVLSYAPRSREFDGRFRRIEVRVKRPHGTLQARKGYLALKTDLPVPALPDELKALARLESGARPDGLSLRVRGLQFPDDAAVSRVPVIVELESGRLSFERDEKRHVFRQDFTILVLVTDASGRVAAKASQHYPIEGPLARLEQARRGSVLFYRELRLPPGRYRIEAIASDARSSASGTAAATLEIPRAEAGRLRASSLMLVRGAEKAAADAGTGPLRYGDVLLYPNLGEALAARSGKPLAFFLSAWPAPGRSSVDARVELLRSGRPVASAPPLALRPGAQGRLDLASTLAVDALPPGAYELRVTLSDGLDAERRSASLALARASASEADAP